MLLFRRNQRADTRPSIDDESNSRADTRLLIGDDPVTGRPYYYTAEESLVTIAGPGTGKTQCHMLPNLLTYPGPAVVLDVKSTLWKETSDHRSEYGPVYRIDLDRPEVSDHYNPFTFISSDPRFLWRDAETAAATLHTQQGGGGDAGHFYDYASLGYLTALIAFIKLKEPLHRQHPGTLIEYVSGTSLDGFLAKAATLDELAPLRDVASTIKRSDERTRGNVIWTARNDVAAWNDPLVMELSRVSDWSPEEIRANNATIYMCLSTEALASKPGFARMVIGQHIRALLRQKVDRAAPTVQFFIDETPQLRRMEIIREGLETGREYNVRLWIVAQSKGQFVSSYGQHTADAMIGFCGLQAYMSPSLLDGSAQAVSEAIGHYEHPFDGSGRQPRVTPQSLAGPDYAKYVIAFDHGQFHKLRKHSFQDDPELRAMAGESA